MLLVPQPKAVEVYYYSACGMLISPNCVTPIPTNNDVMAFHKPANERMEAQSRTKESLSKETFVLKAKQLQMKDVEQERPFKLKEQELKLQADMYRFFQQHMSKTKKTQEVVAGV